MNTVTGRNHLVLALFEAGSPGGCTLIRRRLGRAASLLACICLLTHGSYGQPGIQIAPAMRNYPQLPLGFERTGNASPDRYIARGQGYTIGLEDAKATIGITSGGITSGKTRKAVSLGFVGCHPGKSSPGPELPGKVNVIRGNDPSNWQTGLATYERVSWSNVYPDIDVVYYGNQQQLEFDLVVRPGADPRAVRLKVGGAGKLSIDGSGALNLGAAADGLRIALPQIYQEVNGARKNIRGHYAITGRDEVSFRIDSWDRAHALVIDPTIVYSTLFGGGLNTTYGYGIQVDASGNILIAGYTYAADFPTVNAAQSGIAGNNSTDAFVTKINAAGTALIYSTYLGGSSYDYAQAIAVDSSGSAWVTGYTESSDFPTLNAAQSIFGGIEDAFVTRLSASGVLQFSTFLGGSSYDYGYGIAVDSSNNGYVTGYTGGSFPVTEVTIQPTSLSNKTFATKYTSAGAIVYATLLGGNSTDLGYSIAADSAGNAYVTGYSFSSTFTGAPAGGAQTSNQGDYDAFVAKVNPTGTALVYFTFLGGTGFDEGKAIALDGSGNAYIAGQTSSTGLATTGAAQTSLAGATDGFIAKLNSTGSAFSYITYLGGTRQDYLNGLALDGSGNVYLAGYTDSVNFPTVSAVQSTLPGNGISLFSSSNSGSSWLVADSNIPGAVFDVSTNPSGSSGVVLTESGIYRTTNGGSSWSQQLNTTASGGETFLARSPVATGTIYAVASCCSNIYSSTDDGVTWSYKGNVSSQALGIMADPMTASTVYLFGYTSPYLYKSTDGGATWNSATTGLPSTVVSTMAATSDGTLYAGTQGSGVYKSTNQGASWTAVNNGISSSAYLYPHTLSASGTTVYLAYGTLYTTTNGGTSWTATPSYIGAGQVSVSPLNPAIVYVVTYSETVAESSDGGSSWTTDAGLPSALEYYNPPTQVIADPEGSAFALLVAPVTQSAFVAKLNSAGSALTWSTYLGGNSYSMANGVATDGAGNAFVTGYTSSNAGFPVTSTALPAGTYGTFVTKISDATAACSTLTVNPGNLFASQYGATLTVAVEAPSGCAWTASTNAAWAVVTSGTSGSGSGVITVQASANASGVTQSALLNVASQSVTITQPANSCTYSLDKSPYLVAQGGGTVSATLTTATGCPWTVTNNYSSAVTVASPASGQGMGSSAITLNVAADPGQNLRSFSLSVGTTQIRISQAGTGVPEYQLTTAVSPANAGTITANPASLNNYYAAGSTVCLTATPAAGHTFTGWTGTAVNAAGCLTMTVSAFVTANFQVNPISASSALRFVPAAPCRLVDTRNAAGPQGGPSVGGGSARSFTIPGTCNIPSTALAYSLNLTVVPHGILGYVTMWPTGQPQPVVSTLNSLDGRVKSNAAVVPAGTSGAVSVFATDSADVILDINGYFDSYTDTSALQFYPLTPCRVADTRSATGSLGGPSLLASQARSFPIMSSACGIPGNALAYSLNFTAIPQGPLGYLTVWPNEQSQPVVSTLNAPTGAVTANAAIVPAGIGGAIELFATNNTDMAIDINGYFAAPASGGLSLYNLTPCRIEDTRLPAGTPAFTGTVTETATGVACGVPPEAQSLVLNATVVPSGELGYLSLWANGGSQPVVSTLNSLDGSVTSNMAVVPTTNGLVNAYAAGATYLILDISGYFAP